MTTDDERPYRNHRSEQVKRTFAATLLILTACATVTVSAQEAVRRVAAVGTPVRAKSNAVRPTRVKVSTEDESQKSGAYPDEVDRLLKRNALAQGGIGAANIKSRIMRGRVEMSESPLSGTFESYEKEPDKRLNVLNAPVGQYIQGSDGGQRWQQSPWGFDANMRGGEDGVKDGGPRVQMWRKYFSSASIHGRAVVDGREMVVLAATPKGERPVLMYFDAETWLLVKEEFSPHTPQQENELKAVYIDRYSLVDGESIPTVFRQVYTNFTLTFRIYEVKHNVPIDDALFSNPNGK
jgi:hypothetical protein